MEGATISLDQETASRIEAFLALLQKWNRTINLVSAASMKDGWTRHVEDSLQVLRHGDRHGDWIDVGSGAGFPGMVIALAMPPTMSITLIERDRRKCAFLQAVRRELAVPVSIVAREVDMGSPLETRTVTARGLAPLTKLLGLIRGGATDAPVGLFAKGENWEDEVAAARLVWTFDLSVIPSFTRAGAALLKVENVHAR